MAELIAPFPPGYDVCVQGNPAPQHAPNEHRVQLDAYAGPMDLLLYLVKRHEIDLQDIPMAQLVEQYLAHLRVIETVDVDKAGEFLVMAATLIEVKSAMLMPTPAQGEAGEAGDAASEMDLSGADPRFELVQQLLAYKRFKDAAITLERQAAQWEQRFPVSAKIGEQTDDEDDASPFELDIEDVNVLDLCSAFGRVMESIGHLGDHAVTYDDTPISLHAEDVADRLQRDGAMTLRQLFQGRRGRSEMIGLFLATLELVRQRRVTVSQADLGDVLLSPRPELELDDAADNDTTPDSRDPDTGELAYDWPDERTKRRAERRAKLRAARSEAAPDAPHVEDDDTDDDDTDA